MLLAVVLIGLQVAGFFIIYLLLKRRILQAAGPDAVLDKVRSELNSIMVEINRALYMDERTGERLPGFGEVRRKVRSVIETVIAGAW